MPRRAMHADEIDAVEARRFLVWRRGEVRAIKRRIRRRERREGKAEVRGAVPMGEF